MSVGSRAQRDPHLTPTVWRAASAIALCVVRWIHSRKRVGDRDDAVTDVECGYPPAAHWRRIESFIVVLIVLITALPRCVRRVRRIILRVLLFLLLPFIPPLPTPPLPSSCTLRIPKPKLEVLLVLHAVSPLAFLVVWRPPPHPSAPIRQVVDGLVIISATNPSFSLATTVTIVLVLVFVLVFVLFGVIITII
jgi:hypothetical protein